MDRRWPTTARHQPARSFLLTLREQRDELVKEISPAFAVLVGIALLLFLRPGTQFVAALGHAQLSPLVAFGGQRELDEHRVAGHGLLVPWMVPAERKTSRGVDC